MSKPFRPMKGDDADLSRLVFPYLVSPKLDGHRCVIKGGVALTSALKPFPNQYIQGYFSGGQYDGLDGELVVGPPTAPDVFTRTSSGVRRADGAPDFTFWVFDRWDTTEEATHRRNDVEVRVGRLGADRVDHVPTYFVRSADELEEVERQILAEGYEGVMLRHPESPYKFGRATVKENYLLKLKRFADAEAEIIGFVEQQANTNEKKTNALGRSQRSSAKAGKVGKGTLGNLIVRALNGRYEGVTFEVGTGFDDALRHAVWYDQPGYTGQVITFKYQDVGDYEKPRIPVFKGFRDRAEVA
jgi:DNA ligase-1